MIFYQYLLGIQLVCFVDTPMFFITFKKHFQAQLEVFEKYPCLGCDKLYFKNYGRQKYT